MSPGKEGGASPSSFFLPVNFSPYSCWLIQLFTWPYRLFFSDYLALARPAARIPATRLAMLSSVPVFGNLPSETGAAETAGA